MANMTNKGALNFVLTTFGEQIPADVAEKLKGMIAQIEKKSGAERKPTARQIANNGIKATIAEQMEANVLYLVGDVLKSFDGLGEDMTSQRLSAILNQMVTAGQLTKTTEKGKSYFSLA